MPPQAMPPREAARLARYLLDAGRARRAPERASLVDPEHRAWKTPGDTTRGARLYARHCSACHGAEGRGTGGTRGALPVQPAVHADSARMSARPDDTLFDGIWAGAWVLDGSPRMPAFGGMLGADEVRDLVAYIRDAVLVQRAGMVERRPAEPPVRAIRAERRWRSPRGRGDPPAGRRLLRGRSPPDFTALLPFPAPPLGRPAHGVPRGLRRLRGVLRRATPSSTPRGRAPRTGARAASPARTW